MAPPAPPPGPARLAPPTLDDVFAAREVLREHLPWTPLVRSPELSELLGCDYHVKCESLLPTGAFKVRGGVNLVAGLSDEERRAGIVGSSTGNHGQSLAWAGRRFGVPVVIYAPARDPNPVKLAAMERLGAEVRLEGGDFDEAREACEAAAARHGYRYVHSANEPLHVAGVATAALEILGQLADVEVVIVPVGGGSGAAGAGIVLHPLRPHAELIGVQSAAAPGLQRAWEEGHLDPHPVMATEHEGLATRVPFELTMGVMRRTLSRFLLADDEEIARAVGLLATRARLVAEGAGAASLAGAQRLGDAIRGRKVVGIMSGGNIPPRRLAEILGRS